jgi:hypothetical protein
MFRFSTEEIDERAQLDGNVPVVRIEQNEIRPLWRPVRQHRNEPAFGDEWGNHALGELYHAEAVKAGAQSKVEVVHSQRSLNADLDLLIRVPEFPATGRLVRPKRMSDAVCSLKSAGPDKGASHLR